MQKDNAEKLIEIRCSCCGKKFKTTSFYQDLCDECTLEYIDFVAHNNEDKKEKSEDDSIFY